MVCRWAGESATRARNTTIRLRIWSGEGGENSKENGAEEPAVRVEMHKAQSLGEVKSSGFMVEVVQHT